MSEDEKQWALYAEAASSLTRLHQHSAQQKRDAHNAGYKAALEAVLQYTVKECTHTQANTICAASLINFILPELHRDAPGSAERDGRPGAPHAPPAPPPSAQDLGMGPHAPHARGDGAGAPHAAFGASAPPDGRAGSPHCFAQAASAASVAAQGAASAVGFAYGAAAAAPAGGAAASAGGLVRKRSSEHTADWMDGGAASAGAMQPYGHLPPEWPPLWSKRGRH